MNTIKKYSSIILIILIVISIGITIYSAYRGGDINSELSSNTAWDQGQGQPDKNNVISSVTKRDFYNVFDDLRRNNSGVSISEDLVHSLKEMNNVFHENFNFTELCFQPLYYLGTYMGDRNFCVETQQGLSQINQEAVSSTGAKIITTPLKTALLGKNLCTSLTSLVIEGRGFNELDFLIKDSDHEINVLLGYQYRSVYEIGDLIKLDLLEKKVTLKVIGFLKENVSINQTTVMFQESPTVYELDWSIVMPFYDILYTPSDREELLYQTRYYLQKNCGYIEIQPYKETVPLEEDLEAMERDLRKVGLTHPNLKQYCYYKKAVESLSERQKVPFSISLSPVTLEYFVANCQTKCNRN